MARILPEAPPSEISSHDVRSSSLRRSIPRQTPGTSPSPSASSDKENSSRGAASQAPMEHTPKRRRTETQNTQSVPNAVLLTETQAARLRSNPDLQYYDPNQDADERRQVRKGLRELNREAVDLRAEWLAPGSTGLHDAVIRADSLYQSVRQTSDATIDSRLLVTVGDLTYRKTQQMVSGDGLQGIDVDDFVSKCISFMARGTEGEQTSTQRRRRQAVHADGDEEDNEEGLEQGDALNWSLFGAKACFPSNSRPPVPGFLLGPLSIQKRVRAPIQRRQRLQRNTGETTRPEELKAADMQQAENQTLTVMCRGVGSLYTKIRSDGIRALEEEVDDDMEEEEVQELYQKYHLADNSGIPLFDFALHPTSFGQTVENLFYISFLIKEGKLGLDTDSEGMPTLHPAGGDADEVTQATGERHQAVLSLDFDMWQDLVKELKIRRSLIPDRTKDPSATQIGATGWYN